ncbi:MAG: cell division protein FtsZ, partial [Verrucomicrobiota bacterium]
VTVQLGANLTRGLGAGGDPALGRQAAEREVEALRPLVAGARVVFLLVGLGGGTASGAAPVLARLAREAGALVLGIATMPFDFEGRFRAAHAQEGLHALKAAADAVICLPNQRVLRLLDEKTPVAEVFATANRLLVEGLRGVHRLLTRPGFIQLDFASLERLLRGRHAESAFASVETRGENRAREAVDRILASPFLERGEVLADSEAVLVMVAGGPDLGFHEVEWVVEQLRRQGEQAHWVAGTGVDESLAGRLLVTVVATRGGSALPPVEPARAMVPAAPGAPSAAAPGAEFLPNLPESSPRGPARLVPPAPPLAALQGSGMVPKGRAGLLRRQREIQQTFNFNLVSKGRFEKTEATILNGEDLDLPTFIRRGVALN